MHHYDRIGAVALLIDRRLGSRIYPQANPVARLLPAVAGMGVALIDGNTVASALLRHYRPTARPARLTDRNGVLGQSQRNQQTGRSRQK